MHLNILPVLCLLIAACAGSVHHVHHAHLARYDMANRAVKALDPKATAQAHPRDNKAVRALTGTQIKTSDGKCLFVDPLSGDFRANLTPLQVANCDSSQGQKWDFITKGLHNNVANATLIVSSLTGACGNVDTRRQAGDQVNLFSCGGRADGSGQVTNSQLFKFKATPGPHRLRSMSNQGSCLTVQGTRVGIAACARGDRNQFFVFGGAAPAGTTTAAAKPSTTTAAATTPPPAATTSASAVQDGGRGKGNENNGGQKPTPVTRDGGVLNPTAIAQAQQFDKTATRQFESVSIQADDGRCLSVDPTAGDFRENLIPLALVPCQASSLNQKFDIVTKGKHNDGSKGKAALIVSVLTNGCISFDGRRAANDQVNLFSCGGRADGSGQTDASQLMPFNGEKTMTFSPISANKGVCFKGVQSDRLVSGTCNGRPSRSFKLLFI